MRRLSNLIVNRLETILKRPVLHSIAPGLVFQVSSYCNSNCQLCPVGLKIDGYEKGMMSLPLFQHIIDKNQARIARVGFADWGEPFLNPDMFKMISYANRYSLSTWASTNMHYLDSRDKLLDLVQSGLSELIVSIHAASDKTYQYYQPGKSFKDTIERILQLKDIKSEEGIGPRTSLAFAITKKNQNEIPGMVELARSCDAACDMYTASLNLRFYRQDPKRIRSLLQEWLQDDSIDERSNLHFSKSNIVKMLQESEISSGFKWEWISDCRSPWNEITVNWDGSTSLCCSDYYKYRTGDLNSQELSEIWNNEKYQAVRKKIAKNIPEASIPCSSCFRY
jgi:radical SAM protein with 4Fe4S-binding SPASM domain